MSDGSDGAAVPAATAAAAAGGVPPSPFSAGSLSPSSANHPTNVTLSSIFGEDAVTRSRLFRRRSSIDGSACEGAASSSSSSSPSGRNETSVPSSSSPMKSFPSCGYLSGSGSGSASGGFEAMDRDEKLALAIGVLRVLMNERKVSIHDVTRISRRMREELHFGVGGAPSDGVDEGGGNGAKEAQQLFPRVGGSPAAPSDNAAPRSNPEPQPAAARDVPQSKTDPEPKKRSDGETKPRPQRAPGKPAEGNKNGDRPSSQQPPQPQGPQGLDPSVRYRPIALRFLYDGSAFGSGFAENVGLEGDDSVERALFAALRKTRLVVDRSSCKYSRAGRTDRGVSAWGQTVGLRARSAFLTGCRKIAEIEMESDGDNGREGEELSTDDLPNNSRTEVEVWVPPRAKKAKKKKNKNQKKGGKGATSIREEAQQQQAVENHGTGLQEAPPGPMVRRTLTEIDYPKILNSVLPPTIRVLGWAPVTPSFSARFSCSSRTYRYYFARRDLDLDKMREGLEKLRGRHDFRNMCKMNVEEVYNFVRVVHTAEIVVPDEEQGGGGGEARGGNGGGDGEALEPRHFRQQCHFLIIGQAFLWHQIRCIVSVLFMIGKGLEPPSIIDDLLDVVSNPGKPSYEMAPDSPLVLHSCDYLNLRMGYGTLNLWIVSCDLERRWEELQLAAERLRDGMTRLGTEARVSREDVEGFVRDVAEERRKKGRKGNKRPSTSLLPSPPPPQKRQVREETEGKNGEVAASEGNDGANNGKGQEEGGDLIPWFEALLLIRTSLGGLRPSPTGPKEILHAPLMSRCRGTTYEEKVAALLAAGGGRRERYEENVIGKRKTREEDDDFYGRMLREGGNGE